MHGADAGQLAAALLRAGAGRAGEAAAGESPALSANEFAAATAGRLGFPAWSKHAVYTQLRWGPRDLDVFHIASFHFWVHTMR